MVEVYTALLLLVSANAFAQETPDPALCEDWELAPRGGVFRSTAELGITIFQRFISPGDGPRCNLYPSCSAFGREILRRDGVGGVPVLFNRFMREPHQESYLLAADGVHRLDPVSDHAPIGRLFAFSAERSAPLWETARLGDESWGSHWAPATVQQAKHGPPSSVSKKVDVADKSSQQSSNEKEPGPEEGADKRKMSGEARPGSPVQWLTYLWEQGDFGGIVTESLRMTYDGRDVGGGDEARYFRALAYCRLGNVEAATTLFRSVADSGRGLPIGSMAELAVADCNALHGLNGLAATQYRIYLTNHPEGFWRPRAGWRGAIAYGQLARFTDAIDLLGLAGVEPSPSLTATLSDPPAWRRPGLAALFSAVVPGTGQFYAGFLGEGLSALVINSMFIASMIFTARDGSWAAFSIAGFFELGFYAGNIYGGADAAIRHNRKLRDRIVADLRAESRDWPPAPLFPAPE